MASKRITNQELAIFQNAHLRFAMIVDDPTPGTVDEQLLNGILTRNFHNVLIDDDDIDGGNYDFGPVSGIFLSETVNDPTKINNIEQLAIPIVAQGGSSPLGSTGLQTLKMGSIVGGAGVGWGTTAAQTDIDIVADDHNLTLELGIAALTVQASGDVNWMRAADLVAGAVVLATEAGDANHVVLAVLPDNTLNEDGLMSNGPRIFCGLPEITGLNEDGLELLDRIIEFVLHQTKGTTVARNIVAIREISRASIQRVYPLLADAPLITGAAGWTYSAMITIIPAGTVLSTFRVTGINIEALSDNTEIYVVELSRLSDSSILAEVKFLATNFTTNFNLSVVSQEIAASEGVQGRIATKAGGPDTGRFSITYNEIV